MVLRFDHEIPILVMGFNRPKMIGKLLRTLASFGVSDVWVAVDGPRNDVSSDDLSVAQSQALVRRYFPKARTLFRSENLGCRRAVPDAIDWFFGENSKGIILEDDILPTETFLSFATEGLTLHEGSDNVWQISGRTYLPTYCSPPGPFLSRIPNIWGWATWRDKWNQYDRDLETYDFGTDLDATMRNGGYAELPTALRVRWAEALSMVKLNGIDTWDYQWVWSMWQGRGFALVPPINLVSNIGFGEGATHTTQEAIISASLWADETPPAAQVLLSYEPSLDSLSDIWFARSNGWSLETSARRNDSLWAVNPGIRSSAKMLLLAVRRRLRWQRFKWRGRARQGAQMAMRLVDK